MDDIHVFAESLGQLEDGAAEEREPLGIVRFAIKLPAREVVRSIDKVDRNLTGAIDEYLDTPFSEIERYGKFTWKRTGVVLDLLQIVARHDHSDSVSKPCK